MTGIHEIGRDISSFTEFIRDQAPHLLPHNRVRTVTDAERVPHGTTIVAIAYPGGVLIAGDRRATAGNLIASRDMQKVFIADEYSAVGIAGTAGLAVEMVRLFAVELEHYEKIEGVPLTFAGKANRLAGMVRSNMELAMQGLAAIPLLVGYDEDNQRGRIFGFDVAGDRHEEHGGYQAIGSGSVFAKSSIKKLYRADLDAGAALAIAVEALYDAADDDSATGGPDLTRGLYPTAVRVDADGAVELSSAELAEAVRTVIERRTEELGGTNIGEQPGGARL